MRGTEKKQVQTPQSLCLREKHKVEGEYGMLCVRSVQRVRPADAPVMDVTVPMKLDVGKAVWI